MAIVIPYDAKKTGAVLVAISLVLILIFLSSTSALKKSDDIECSKVCGINMTTNSTSCPHENELPIQSYAGFSISFIIGGIGAYMIYTNRKQAETIALNDKKLEKTVAILNDDEKKVYTLLKAEDGALLQSDLMEKSGFTKVKVSRVLDKLEGRGLVERKRRGMTNLIIIRRQ